MTVLAGSVAGGGTADFFAATDVFGTRYQAVASGTVDQVQCAVRAGGSFTSLNFAVYSDSASLPNVVLGSVTGAVTSNTAGTKTGAWPSGPAIVSGTFYWLFVWVVGGAYNYTGNTGSSGNRGQSALNTFETPWSTVGDSTDASSTVGLPILVEQIGGGAAPTMPPTFNAIPFMGGH